MIHLHISVMLDAAGLMTHLEIQCCLDESSSGCDITVASKRLRTFPQGVAVIDRQNSAAKQS